VTIPQAVVAEMLAHAREEAPRECCGLLIGRGEAVEGSVRARNIDPRATRYLIDPDDHFAAIREARSRDRMVIGAYHSHPASAPVPSETDIAEANSGADFLYVIVSLVGEDVRAFRFNDGRAIEVSFTPCPSPLTPDRVSS
jgi:proteasome lid subunit RPN8/RPN11